jgi:hypothetical protein
MWWHLQIAGYVTLLYGCISHPTYHDLIYTYLCVSFIFRHPDDVDLFVGVNHENHLPDALVGPVSACIIGIQFQHLKYGDRLFYTHQGEFTLGINT